MTEIIQGEGGTTTTAETPLDYKLSQDLRRSREEVERAERQLQDLGVEANLAGVPEDWRQPEAPEGAVEEGPTATEPR